MKIKILILVIVVFFGAMMLAWLFRKSAPTPQITSVAQLEDPTIVAFGDSLVKGEGASSGKDFPSQLAKMINEPVENMGRSGETSAQGLARLDTVLARDPDIVILLFGGNDFLRRLPPQETFANLESMIRAFQENDTQVVLLGIQGGIFQDRYEELFEELAQETDALYVSNVLEGLLGEKQYMSDVVHPNDAGYALIAERVAVVLKGILGR